MRNHAMLIVAFGLANFMVPATALAEEGPAATSTCPPIPYTVGEAASSNLLSARLSIAAITKLSTLPNLEGAIGKDVMRTAYAGMRNQAAFAVLETFGCRVEEYIRKSDVVDKDEKIAAVQQIVAGIALDISIAQAAADSGFSDMQVVASGIQSQTRRLPGAATLDPSITKAALADIDPNKLFISVEMRDKLKGLSFGPVFGVTSCSAVLKSAISDGGSSLQVALASLKSIFINFADPEKAPLVAKAAIFSNFALSNSTAPSVAPANFGSCTKGIAEQEIEPVDASPPVADAPVAEAQPQENTGT